MIPGISSSGGYAPTTFINKVRTSNSPAQPPAPEVQREARPEDLRAPEGDEKSLAREFNLFDLATRQFSTILPRVEMATVPVE